MVGIGFMNSRNRASVEVEIGFLNSSKRRLGAFGLGRVRFCWCSHCGSEISLEG